MTVHEIHWNPSSTRLRWVATSLPVGAAVAAWLLWWKFNVTLPGIWLVGAGLLLGLLGWLSPRLFLPVYRVWTVLSFPAGWLLSHLVLLLIFFGILTPIALVLRMRGHDPLQLKWDKDAETYWSDRDHDSDPQRYFRQY